jgi:hypothetical protein
MSHPLTGWSGLPGNKSDDRLCHVLPDKLSRVFLIGAADFADQYNSLSIRIFFKCVKTINKISPDYRVTADTDCGLLSQPFI